MRNAMLRVLLQRKPTNEEVFELMIIEVSDGVATNVSGIVTPLPRMFQDLHIENPVIQASTITKEYPYKMDLFVSGFCGGITQDTITVDLAWNCRDDDLREEQQFEVDIRPVKRSLKIGKTESAQIIQHLHDLHRTLKELTGISDKIRLSSNGLYNKGFNLLTLFLDYAAITKASGVSDMLEVGKYNATIVSKVDKNDVCVFHAALSGIRYLYYRKEWHCNAMQAIEKLHAIKDDLLEINDSGKPKDSYTEGFNFVKCCIAACEKFPNGVFSLNKI